MNRNFVKISVSIVVLVLVLACCLTGCKVNDVAADLGTTKDEIAANKADAGKALEAATKALEEKIAANKTDCADEIAAVNAALEAAKKSDEDLADAIAAAEKALGAAIDAVQADLEAAKVALSNKIAANEESFNSEIAALSAAIQNAQLAYEAANAELSVAVVAYMDECVALLEEAIEAVAADVAALTKELNAAVKSLKTDMAAGNKSVVESINAVSKAVTEAEAKAATADAELKVVLEQVVANASKVLMEAIDYVRVELDALEVSVDEADAAIYAAIEAVKTDLQGKIDTLDAAIDSVELNSNQAEADLAAEIAKLQAAIGAINADTTVAEQIAAIEADIDTLYAVIATYQETTEEVVKAWHEIFATYQIWNEVKGSYGDIYVLDAEGNKVAVNVDTEYASAQVRLYRALNAEDVAAVKADFFAVIRNVKSDALDTLNTIYAYLNAAAAGLDADQIDIAGVREDIDAAAELLAEFDSAKIIVDGKVVDLDALYAIVWDNYNECRVDVVKTYLAAAEFAATDARDASGLAAVRENLALAIAEIDALAADEEEVADLVEEYNAIRILTAKILARFASVAVADATVDTWFDAADDLIASVKTAIDALAADVDHPVDTAEVVELYNNVRIAKLAKINLWIDIDLEAADMDALAEVKDHLDALKADIDALAAEINVDALYESYNATVDAYYSKLVLFIAADLTADMNEYNDNLAAIYAEIKNETTNMADIRAAYVAFLDNRDYVKAFQTNSESEVLVALTAAEEAFVKTEALKAALIEGLEAADEVATILESEEFDEITGTKNEFEVIKSYRGASAEWVASLDEFYANFTDNDANKATYNEIKALIEEAKFTEINTEFETAIADLIEAADAVTKAIKDFQAAVEADGIQFSTVEAVEAAWDAVWTWMGLATDEDGVAFIIDWRSEGELAHEDLVDIVNAIDTQYKTFVEAAKADWTACNTDAYKALTVENVKYYTTDLEAVRAWFTTYGVITADYAEEHDIMGVGTDADEADLAALEARLADAKVEREELIADLAAQAAALQERIDNLGNITTDSKATVVALRADYDAWVKACETADKEVEQNEENGTVVNADALVAAEAKLEQLRQLGTDIATSIIDLRVPELDMDTPVLYFANDEAQEAYAEQVAAIEAKLEQYFELNDGNRDNFSAEALKKVADCKLYAVKYEALVAVYEAYNTVDATAAESVKGELVNYLNKASAQIDSYDSSNANAAAIIRSIGNGALAQFEAIAAKA